MNLSVSKGSGQFGDSITVSWQTTQDGGTLSITDGQNTQDITGQASGSVTWTLNGPKGGKQVYHCTQQGDALIDEAYASVDILADAPAATPPSSSDSSGDSSATSQAGSTDPTGSPADPSSDPQTVSHTIQLSTDNPNGHFGDLITVTWSAPNYTSDSELWITDGPNQNEKNISDQTSSSLSWALNGPRGGKQVYHCFQKKDGVITDEAFASVDILNDDTGDQAAGGSGDGAAGQSSGIAATAAQFTSVKFSLDPSSGDDPNPHSVQASTDAQITLEWDTLNATGIRIDTLPVSSPLGTTGSIVIPTHEASYNLVAINADGDGPAWPFEIHTHDPGEVVSQHADIGPGLGSGAGPGAGSGAGSGAADNQISIELSTVIHEWTHEFSIVEEGPIKVSIEVGFALTGGSVEFAPGAAFGKDQAPDHQDQIKTAIEGTQDASPFLAKDNYEVKEGGGIVKPSVQATTDGVSLQASWTVGHMGDTDIDFTFTLLSLGKDSNGKVTAGALKAELGATKSWTIDHLQVADGVTITNGGVELSLSAVADPNWSQIAEYVGETIGADGLLAVGFVVVGVAAIAVYIDAIETVAMWDTIPGQVSDFAADYSRSYLAGITGALALHDTGDDGGTDVGKNANTAGRQMAQQMITKVGFRDKAQDWWTQNQAAVTTQVNATALTNAQTAIWNKLGPGESYQTQKGTWLHIFNGNPASVNQVALFQKYADKSGSPGFLSGSW